MSAVRSATCLLVVLATAGHAAPPKKIYGHYMGCFAAGTGAIQWHARSGLQTMDPPQGVTDPDPAKRKLAAWARTSFGGTYRNFALAPFDRALTLDEAADLEVRRAMRIGLDGFTFDAWAGGGNAIKLLDAMFRICEERHYPFELTVTLDSSCLADDMPELKAYTGNKWVKCVKWLLDKHGTSPNLARRAGKPLVMGYQSLWPAQALLQEQARANVGAAADKATAEKEYRRLILCEEGWKLYGEAYRQLEAAIGQPLYWEFCLNAFFYPVNIKGVHPPAATWVAAARTLAKDFPALGEFMNEGPLAELAQAVQAQGGEWCPPIFLQYENYGYFQAASRGTDTLRRDWALVREQPATLLQYITWNDYHENTNLSPGYNTRYSYYDLTGWYIQWWKTGAPPVPDHDRVYVFSHKYAHGTPLYPFKAKTRTDNVIEVVSLLPQPATLRLPGRDQEWEAPAGYSFKQVPLTPGPVVVELLRGGQVVTRLEHPEPVSDRPFRQDTGKTCWSTEEQRHWRADFGEQTPMFVYSEYGDDDHDGLPNWFEMLWFGKFGDLSTATGAAPDADPYHTGKTNLQHYRDQTDPTQRPEVKP